MRGWDEFSEFLLENRVPTSADFNTYPIRIFICYSYLIILVDNLPKKYFAFLKTLLFDSPPNIWFFKKNSYRIRIKVR